MNPIVRRAGTENAVGRNPMSYRPDPVSRVGIDQGEGMWTGSRVLPKKINPNLTNSPMCGSPRPA